MKKLSLETSIAPASAAGQSGVLALANENRMEAANYSQPVTDFMIGVLGTDLAALVAELDLIAPPVRTARRFEYKKQAAGLSFLADQNDERAPGAKFRRVEAGGSSVNAKTANRGLSITLDRDELVEGSIEQAAKWLTAILLRNELIRAVAALDAGSTNTPVTFSASTDPHGLIETALIAAHTARGIYPNKAICGLTAWSKARTAYRASTKAGALALAAMTPDELAQALALEALHVSKTVYKTTGSGDKTQFLSNLIYAYFTEDVANKDDGSNIKRFWTPCEGGEQIRVYVDETQAKTVEVIVEMYSTVAVTDSTGIRKLTVS